MQTINNNHLELNLIDIKQLVPHREPMLLVDRLCQFDELSAQCEHIIRADEIFFAAQQQAVPSYIGIEYMAQTIAAYAGMLARQRDEAVKAGFLLGSRRITCHVSEFALGQRLLINVTELHREASGLSVFQCQIEADQQCLVEANVNVFQPPNFEQYLRGSL